MATYLEKLRDPRWIECANRIKLRDGNRCRDCHEARHQLEKDFARWRSMAGLSLAQIIGELAVRQNFLDGFDPELVAEFDRICALALRKYGDPVPA